MVSIHQTCSWWNMKISNQTWCCLYANAWTSPFVGGRPQRLELLDCRVAYLGDRVCSVSNHLDLLRSSRRKILASEYFNHITESKINLEKKLTSTKRKNPNIRKHPNVLTKRRSKQAEGRVQYVLIIVHNSLDMSCIDQWFSRRSLLRRFQFSVFYGWTCTCILRFSVGHCQCLCCARVQPLRRILLIPIDALTMPTID